jgi:hypothetical protein
MSCPNIGKLCNNFIISQSVTFANNTLTINIPDGVYENGHKYCLVVAQTIPTDTTISSPVVVTIGEETTEYPLVKCNCTPVYACSLANRTRYSTKVETEIGGGVFKLLGNVSCPTALSTPASLPIVTAPTAENNGG